MRDLGDMESRAKSERDARAAGLSDAPAEPRVDPLTDCDRLSRTRQVMRHRAGEMMQSGDGQQRLPGRQLMGYHDMLVDALDGASGGTYGKVRGQHAQDAAVREAHQRGRGIFGPAEHPQYLAEEAARMSDPAYDMLLASARDEARRVMSSSRGDLSAVSALASPGSSAVAAVYTVMVPSRGDRRDTDAPRNSSRSSVRLVSRPAQCADSR